MTKEEMKKLREHYMNHPEDLEKLNSNSKGSMFQFLLTGVDIMDTVGLSLISISF